MSITRRLSTACLHNSLVLVIIVAFSMLCSCEKVIQLEIDEAEKKYVIEGNVSNLASVPVEVRLSQTKSFDDESAFNGVGGATVVIKVDNSTTYTLDEISPGIYQTSALTGLPGSSYELTVTVNGFVFSAVSIMPGQLVSLDTLTVDDLAFGGSNNKTIHPSYLDPAGLGNSYRFVQYANGVQVKKVFVQNDALSDGLRITRPLINRDGDLESGMNVRVEMLHIDPNVYKYWYSLDQAATGENQSAAPANPITNIRGGALGYFSAHSISSKTIRIP
jgi:hypothetical protein